MSHLKKQLAVALALILASAAQGGPLDSPAAPSDSASGMYTLESLYQRLDTGASGTKRSGVFVEPSVAPANIGYTLDEIMAAMPTVDDTNGATAGEVLEGKTFWGLRSDGTWGLTSGSLTGGGGNTYNAGVPKTGQTKCYDTTGNTGSEITCADTKQDGELQVGVAPPSPRFTDNGDGTVTDNLTGLIWLDNANCPKHRLWADALTDIDSLNSTGIMNGYDCGDTSNGGSHQTDWRLPNVKELQSLIDFGYIDPALSNAAGTAKWSPNDPFSDVQIYDYWSATSRTQGANYAWYVDLGDGRVGFYNKAYDYGRVWPVRGGQ